LRPPGPGSLSKIVIASSPKPKTHFTIPLAFAITRTARPLRRDAILTPLLTSDFSDQDEAFSRAFAILQQAVADHVFPCASAAVTHRGKLVALKAFGRLTYDSNAPAAQAVTIFDLASVSKVVATTTMAVLLYQRGLLDLEMPVVGVMPEFASDESGNDPRRGEITLRMLLAHSSGLPAHRPLYERARTRDELVRCATKAALTDDPGMRAEYSDIGFIVLGEALARLADENLDTFCQREIFGPLGMAHTGFNPLPEQRPSIPPTVNDLSFRHRVVQGEINDENASVMGGVAGHAGLFAPAEDVALFAQAMLNGGVPVLRTENLALFTRRESLPPGTSRALGWDTPSQPSQSGQYFSPMSFGHLGYTGTSLWIDPECHISITLLSNRTWPDGTSKAIQQVRPRFHNAVMESLGCEIS
jgi:CubicO group peptidase (beta-lactamase class C family)